MENQLQKEIFFPYLLAYVTAILKSPLVNILIYNYLPQIQAPRSLVDMGDYGRLIASWR